MTGMDVQEILAILGEDGCGEDIARHWEQSMAKEEGVPPFLTPGQILEARAWCGFADEFDQDLINMARHIAQNEALCRLAWHCKWRLFDCDESRELMGWPTFAESLHDRRGLFYLLVGLAMVPRVRAFHRSLGVPEHVTRATCTQVRNFCETYQQGHDGRPGIQLRRISWLRHYVREPIFRVGRLEYWLKPNPCYPTVYQCRTSGSVLALAWDRETFTEDGYIDPERADATNVWQSKLTVDDDNVRGHPISPFGMALRREVSLSLARWTRVLTHGDTVLQVHIPSGSKMTLDAIKDSMNAAVVFFQRYLPSESPVAFVSTSWAFSNLLETLLPPESNTVRYQRELYLFPIPSGGYGGLSFIFPEDQFDPRVASRETCLQRAVLDLLSAGKRWRIGGMFMLIDDLQRFGLQCYRSAWPPAEFRSIIGGEKNSDIAEPCAERDAEDRAR